MEKKLAQINEEFEHLRFENCLTIIDQTLKKYSKADKKKPALSLKEIKMINCFKVGSLVSLGRYHEANPIYQELIEPEALRLIGEEYGLLLSSISELFGDGRQRFFIEALEKEVPNLQKGSLHRFYLSSHLFSQLSKLFLKDYIATKNIVSQFGQVYLEYLQSLDLRGLLEYKRDGCFRHDKGLNLKMVAMFLDKCAKAVSDNLSNYEKELKETNPKQKVALQNTIKLCHKMLEKANETRLKMLIHEGRPEDSIKLYAEVRDGLKFPFKFIESILGLKDLAGDGEAVELFYLGEMSRVFRNNLNLKNYTPWYDYYNQFLNKMIKKAQQANIELKNAKIQQQLLPLQQLYQFASPNPIDVLTHYYRSLFSQYTQLVDTEHPEYAKNKASDFYKICLKGLLLQLIQLSLHFGLNSSHLRYLASYTQLFQNTLTFSQELKQYWQTILQNNILSLPQTVVNDNQLIQEINYHKIKVGVETKTPTYEGFQSYHKEWNQLYHNRVKEVEKKRKLQKGERYISDEFYTLLADYARAYIQTSDSAEIIIRVTNLMINDLEYAVEVSPYNADIKLRLMHFCGILNHHDRMLELFLTNDIKSVQWETLGYWFIRVGIEFGLSEHNDQFADKMVKSYQENQRQTSEYGLKALKAGQVDRVDEYLSYRKCVLESYNSVMILYMLYLRYRFEQHSEFYLLKIHQKLGKFKAHQRQLTFNADFKVLNNQLFSNYGFADFYGIFNSYELLHYEVQLNLHQESLVSSLLEKGQPQLSTPLLELPQLEQLIASYEPASIFDFSKYTFQEASPFFAPSASKYTFLRTQQYLRHYQIVTQLRITVIMLVSELHRFTKGQQIQQAIAELKDKVKSMLSSLTTSFTQGEYLSQVHSIGMIRRGLFESYNLLSLIRQVVQKSKKLKFASAVVNEAAGWCLQELMDRILGLRWVRRMEEPESKLVIARDQDIENQISIDVNKAKRLVSKYASLYKI